MIVVYEKKTNKVIGTASRVFDTGQWREATIEELYPDLDHGQLGCLYVEDSPKYALRWHDWQLKLDAGGTPVDVELKPLLPRVWLSTDAVDTDGDAIPELPADGKSKAAITIEVKDEKQNIVKKNFALRLTTTGGALSARSITAKNGKAAVTLTSTLDTISVTVNVTGETVKGAVIAFEFMPPV